MGKVLSDQELPAELIGNADPAGTIPAGADEKGFAGEGTGKTAARPGKTSRFAPATKMSQKWLREIAKTAASVRWQRGD